MKKNNLLILLIIFLICIFFIGCSIPSGTSGGGGGDGNDNNGSIYIPGSTLPSSITTSTPIVLPTGVSASKITGGVLSLISTFPMSLNLTNNTSTTYNYTFKAGSNFWACAGDIQNLIIVWDVSIPINPGNNGPIILPTFCLNSSLGGPGIYDNFILGTIYTGGNIDQIINIIKTKNPATFDFFDLQIIQSAVWECMENGSLDPATISSLNAL